MPALTPLGVLGCTAPPPTHPVATAPRPTDEQPRKTPPALAPLTSEQRALQDELEAYANHLSALGERSVEQHWELADAADYVATQWERMGFTLERHGYDVGDVVAQNLEVRVAGGDLGRQSIIVGAHYDTLAKPEGDDASTGIAALLTLSHALVATAPRRQLRFVAYALGEEPHSRRESMGSLHHAREMAARGESVTVMIGLDSLGYFSDAAHSQQTLPGVDVPLPEVGNFLLLLGSESAEGVSRALTSRCDTPGLPMVARTLVDPDADSSLATDTWPYRQSGVPTILITDTRALRRGVSNSPPHSADFVRLARFVSCMIPGLQELANAPPDAPGGESSNERE